MAGTRVVFVLRQEDLAETIEALHLVSVEDLDQAAPLNEGAKQCPALLSRPTA
jgi:hypothetical protein